MLKRTLGLLVVTLALLSGCGSLDNRVAATCDDEVGDVKDPYAWADVRSATVIADQDTIEAVVEFAEPLPDDIHGDITFIVGILRPPDDDHSDRSDRYRQRVEHDRAALRRGHRPGRPVPRPRRDPRKHRLLGSTLV